MTVEQINTELLRWSCPCSGIICDHTRLIDAIMEKLSPAPPAEPRIIPCDCGDPDHCGFYHELGEVDVEPLPAQPEEALLGKVVRVDNERFNGFGYVTYESGPRKPIVSVLLENGNEWDYDAETVRLATPEEIRLAPKVVQVWAAWAASEKETEPK